MSEWNDWMKMNQQPYGWREGYVITTTTRETGLGEDYVRRIVREELADIMPIDVPDAPPEDLK